MNEADSASQGGEKQAAAPEKGSDTKIPYPQRASAHVADPQQRAALQALLEEFADCFGIPEGLPPDRDGLVHHIHLKPGSVPTARTAISMCAFEREECRRNPPQTPWC